MTLNNRISKLEMARLLGVAVDDIAYDTIVIQTYERDEEGNIIMVGPSFAAQPRIREHKVVMVEPGRPVGTTVANGAKPKTRKTDAE